MTAQGGTFERLDRRLVAMRTVMLAGIVLVGSLPVGTGIHSDERSVWTTAGIVLGGATLIMLANVLVEFLRWRATRFRITAARFELSFQFVVTRRRSLSRDRIRTVDVTASPVHRLFGLATVVIGTGQQGGSGDAEIKLDPVSRDRADALRVELLRPPDSATDDAEQSEHTRSGGLLATVDWRWAAYAPLSFVTVMLGAAAVAAVVNVASWFAPAEGAVEYAVEAFVRAAVLLAYLGLALAALVVGVVAALLLFVEMWWGYRLEREPGGTVRVRRGLLTTRSISIEERRLRGVELVEPVGIRLARAARVDAVATGMQQSQGETRTDHKTLLPAAPRTVVDRVASEVLAEQQLPGATARLARHPRAALARRMRWALAPVLLITCVPAVVAALLDGGRVADIAATAAWVVPLIFVPVSMLLAWDAYRNLGHGIAGDYLVTRRGALRRSTVALHRSGVVGWTVRQSIFQRRAGLLTLVATTAAGAGTYQVPDVGDEHGLAWAEEVVPGLLTPFVEGDRSMGVAWESRVADERSDHG